MSDFYWLTIIIVLPISIGSLIALVPHRGNKIKRLYSATKFILYTAGSSIFLLMGVVGMGLYSSNEPTLNFETLANQSYPVALKIIFYFGFLIAYVVKSLIIPLHTWLPDTHGGIRLVRVNMELLPHAHSIFSPWLMIVGTIQIIYAALTSLGQCNLKKRIAYSSISHMSFIIIEISSITDVRLNEAILQIISHGFIGAALFFLAGTSYDRIRLHYLNEMGEIAILMPKIFMMFSSLSMTSLALPGMSGFVAEFVIFFGIITSPKYQIFILMCILLPIIGIGIYPDFVLSLSVDKVETILSNYFHGECCHSDSNRDALALLPKNSRSINFTMAACSKLDGIRGICIHKIVRWGELYEPFYRTIYCMKI
ncbi:unnamed protein product [Victoria cruziana]